MEKKLAKKTKINVLKSMDFANNLKFNFSLEPEKNRLLGIINRDKKKIADSLKLKKLMF